MGDDRSFDLLKEWFNQRFDNIDKRFDNIDERFDELPCKAHSDTIAKVDILFARRKRITGRALAFGAFMVTSIVGNVLTAVRVWWTSKQGG